MSARERSLIESAVVISNYVKRVINKNNNNNNNNNRNNNNKMEAEKDRDEKNQFEEHPNSIYLIILLKGTSG
jgi:hypothetical protein